MSDKTPIQLPPGVYRTGSQAEMQGKWYDTQLVRWVGGVLRPVGGWERAIPSIPFASKVRATHTWVTLNGINYTAILCEEHLYVMTDEGTVTDISPTPSITPPHDTTTGGYGDYFYNYDTYGTPRPDKEDVIQIGQMWSLDNFGDDLLAMASSDGRLLRWQPGVVGGVAEVVTDAPIGRLFVVTAERHVMVFWSDGKFNRFDWCAQEDVEDWDYASITNTAGFYEVEPASPFITAIPTRYGIISFTAVGAYFIRYLGVPYVYSYEFLGYFNGPVSGSGIQQYADTVMWFSTDGFWTFDGQTISPLTCPLLDWVQDVIDPIWKFRRMVGVYSGVQSEVWFFFPENGNQENTHYVSYNFEEKWWAKGQLSRTCGHPGSVLSYPIMSDGMNLYYHEKGLFYYDAPELPFAQTAGIQMSDGARLMTMRKGIVDTRAPAADVEFIIGARKDRISDGTQLKPSSGRLAVRRDGGKIDFRVTGRELTIRIQSARNGVEPWTFGKLLCQVSPRGGR